jgi:phage-related protein
MIINVIHRLAFVGQALIDTDMVKRLDNPIWELRKGYHRILYAEDRTFNGFIMLSAFWKESRHTPLREINRANRHWQDYLQHHKVKEYDILLDEKMIPLWFWW